MNRWMKRLVGGVAVAAVVAVAAAVAHRGAGGVSHAGMATEGGMQDLSGGRVRGELDADLTGLAPDPLQASESLDVLTRALAQAGPVGERAALFALARLGDPRSLEAVEAVAARTDAAERENALYARVVAAQIRAVNGKAPTTRAELRDQMERLLAEVGLSAAAAQRELRAFAQTGEAHGKQYELIRAVALQLSDMALMASNRGIAAAAAASPVDLTVLPFTRAKAEYSRIPPERRFAAAIEQLAAKQVLRAEDDCWIQLLIGEGQAAEAAVIEKLRLMQTDPASPRAGYGALLRVLRGIGTDACREVVTPLLQHRDSGVRYDAESVLRDLAAHQQTFVMVGY